MHITVLVFGFCVGCTHGMFLFLLQAALPSLTNPPSLSPIRRKGKEKEPGEQASAPLSPKKGSEASAGRWTGRYMSFVCVGICPLHV